MAILRGSKLYVGGRDLSGDATAVAITIGREDYDDSDMADDTVVYALGRLFASLEAEGKLALGADLADEEIYNAVANLTQVPIILGLPGDTSGEEGEAGYAFVSNVGKYSPFPGGEVGKRADFAVSSRAAGSIIRGTFAHDGDTARTVTADGTAFNLGAVAADEKLYACIMCLAASGTTPTLNAVIAGDTLEAFSDTPATHITFDEISAAGAYQWVEIDGALTDSWFRPEWTIAGTNPSFRFVIIFAKR